MTINVLILPTLPVQLAGFLFERIFQMPKTPTTRFADPGLALYDLATYFWVHCPKCDGRAIVNNAESNHRLTCTHCHHVEMPGHWHGSATIYVSVKCRECHAPIRKSAAWEQPWTKLKVKCEKCGDECSYDGSVSKSYVHQGLLTDSFYGLPLWLQTNLKEDLFWAFNPDHLELMRQYIAAKHRERGISPRNTIRKNSALLSRLPAFITKASNREPILKLIDKLLQK
jgi:hypothetical protein